MSSPICARFIHESQNIIDVCLKFSSLSINDLTESLLETKLQALEEDWQSLRRSYEGIYLALDEVVDIHFKKEAKCKFENCREHYQQTKAEMMDFIKVSKASSENAQRGNGPMHSTVGDPSAYFNATYGTSDFGVSVPPCDAPDFHGTYKEWPSFRDMFTAVYISKIRMPDVQKLLYLRKKAKGEASSIVNKYPLTNDGFSLAWEALRARYENKRILVDIQLKALFNIPRADYESAEAINNIQTTISDCLALLSSQEINVEHWDPILVYLCSTKIPTETLALWEQSLVSNSILPSWSQMEQFLIKRHRVVERIVGITKDRIKQTQSDNCQDSQSLNAQHSKCILCERNHNLRICSKFIGFSLKQRNSFVLQNDICKNCLSLSHRVSDCISRYRCNQCGNKHHSMLHMQKSYNSQNSKESSTGDSATSSCYEELIHNNEIVDRSDQLERSHFSESAHRTTTKHNFLPVNQQNTLLPTSRVESTTTQTLLSVNEDDTLLPTALVQIMHSVKKHTVRALIDSGSKTSLLTEEVSKRLGLITNGSNVKICGLGDSVVANCNEVCNVTLYSERNKIQLSSKVVIFPHITNLMPSLSLPTPDISDISELDLADPNFLASAQIDMLLGSDVIPYIVLDGMKKNILGSLIAQNSIYGWYIFGPLKSHGTALVTSDGSPEPNCYTKY
ncbi:uncharacterized protein LOC135961250 [Calliphora vicina]|uniref:uncharacterized protein LOC135961250 n=1 Tax=Calliphora vicina TaxID=7373 RepID=UPI00325AC1F6